MARGNGGDDVFVTDDDRKSFLFRLGQVCGSHGWKVHAWVLMGNHFHLLLETPQQAIRRGWYLGKDTFKDKLLKMLERSPTRRTSGTPRTEGANRDHGEKEALRILREGSRTSACQTRWRN